MAIITAPSMADTVYQGPQGNLSVAEGWIILNKLLPLSAVNLLELPIGVCIYGVNVVAPSLGANINLAIECSNHTLVGAMSCTNAIAKYIPIKSYTTRKAGEILCARIGGHGSASGLLTVGILYVAVGH